MTSQEQIVQQIRDVLASQIGAVSLSEKLFSPAGLFSQLAPTEAERRTVVVSELFRDAQDRFHELQQIERQAFSTVVSQIDLPPGNYRFKIEPSESRH